MEYTTAPVARLYAPQAAVTDHLRALLAVGLGQASAGAPGAEAPEVVEELELTAALRVALETPDAAARWLAGEPLFEAAKLPPRAGGAAISRPGTASNAAADRDPGTDGV